VWLPALREPRGRDPRTLLRWWPKGQVGDSVDRALEQAAMGGPGLVLVCGSLYLIGELSPL
jgi:folylpolyglutamate synthase/dihydropteroate synthase